MSLSRGLIIKSGRPTLPTWGFRALFNGDASLAAGTWGDIIPVSGDLNVAYILVRQTSIPGGRDIEVRATVDGNVVTGTQVGAVQNTWYYAFLDDNTENIVFSVTRNRFGNDTEWPGQSARVEYRPVGGGVTALQGRGRAWQL